MHVCIELEIYCKYCIENIMYDIRGQAKSIGVAERIETMDLNIN